MEVRTRKELIYLNMSDLTSKEIEKLSDYELNACDICGEIELSERLNWIDGENFWDNKKAIELLKVGHWAVCDACLEKDND